MTAPPKPRPNHRRSADVDPVKPLSAVERWGPIVLSFDAVEDACERKRTTLVIHPAIRRALKGYEESFYLGLRCFLSGDTSVYFLPLTDHGHVRLTFSLRTSCGGHQLLRVDPASAGGLERIKASQARNAG
jgi:hypothetical protein